MEETKKIIEVIEDEMPIMQSLRDVLTREGFDVVTALDGEEGFRIAIEKHPDLILLDIVMPKVDGLTMLEKLRQDDWGKNAMVFALTNYGDPEKVAKATELKVKNYLVKIDWDLEEVIRQIKRELEA